MNSCCPHCEELKKRLSNLEEFVYRKHTTALAVRNTIARWPGAFTIQHIEAAIKEFKPDVFAVLKPYAVQQQVSKLERDGVVTRTVHRTNL